MLNKNILLFVSITTFIIWTNFGKYYVELKSSSYFNNYLNQLQEIIVSHIKKRSVSFHAKLFSNSWPSAHPRNYIRPFRQSICNWNINYKLRFTKSFPHNSLQLALFKKLFKIVQPNENLPIRSTSIC